MPSGYQDPAYIRSVSGADTAISLIRSGGSLIKRRIADTGLYDAAAPYPFLVCTDWKGLEDDVRDCGRDFVSISAVTDPLSDVEPGTLNRSFAHLVRPYKRHFVIDLTRPPSRFINPHHLKCARSALRKVVVERCRDPSNHVDEWISLYANLVRRHSIAPQGLGDRASVALMLKTDGLAMFRALDEDMTVGMVICITSQDRVYFHLGAYTDRGYRVSASYALIWWIIQHFAEHGFHIMNIGAGAGVHGDENDGLNKFKGGWASGTRLAYLCGGVLDHDAYSRLAPRPAQDDYFPAYRSPSVLNIVADLERSRE